MRSGFAGVVAFAIAFGLRAASGEEPPHPAFAPPPPGQVVQSQLVYLAGEAMHSQWRGVVSKQRVGADHGTSYYQWYLSIYQIDGTTYHLRYRSPQQPVPFETVEKATGAALWFPQQGANVVGTGEFMGPGAQQLVVESRQASADCGTARVDVFFFDAAMQMVMTTLSVENGCALKASIVHRPNGDALRVTGPYYGPNAAMCCPTKVNATALLTFRNGTWTESPRYFKLKNP